jgi:uncharacterized protein YcbX
VIVTGLHTYPIKGCHRLEHGASVVEPWGLAEDRRWLIVTPDGVFLTQRETPALAVIRPTPADDGLLLTAPGMAPLAVTRPTGAPDIQVTVWRSTVAATTAGAEAAAWLSAYLDRPVLLVWLDDPTRRTTNPDYSEPGDRVSFADGYPMLLASEDSLAQLNDWMAEDFPDDYAMLGPLPMTRFRPNIIISGGLPWVEDSFTGRKIRVGDTVFRVPKPCARCVVTTVDQETAERTRQPLRTLARHRKVDQDLFFATNLIPDNPVDGTKISIGDAVELCEP